MNWIVDFNHFSINLKFNLNVSDWSRQINAASKTATTTTISTLYKRLNAFFELHHIQ